MATGVKLFLFVFVCVINAKVSGLSRAKIIEDEMVIPVFKDSDSDGDLFDLSPEINSNEKEVESSIIVCRENGVSRCHCDKKERRVDCQRENLLIPNGDDIEDYLLTTTNICVDLPKYVYLTNNKISELKRSTFLPGMEDTVEGIDLGMNTIDDIHEGAFDNFNQLRKLRLNHNRIQISTQTDGWITAKLGRNLTLLNLAYNDLKSVNDGAFDVLHNLDKLILDGNKNLQLTDDTFGPNGLTKLTMLSLDYCNLVALPDDLFKHLPKLSYLSLIGNPLTSVPKAVMSINSLHTLDLSETSFTSLTGSPFNGLDTVNRLFLKDMKHLEEIEHCGLCGLHYLNEIDLSNSPKLKTISQSAFGVSANIEQESLLIVDFNVENCNLTSLPEKLLNWEYVERLRLGGNPWDCAEMNWLIVDHDLHLSSGQNKPVCHAPERYEAIPLQQLIDEAHGRNTYSPAVADKLLRDKCRRSLMALIFLSVTLIPASILLIKKYRQIRQRRTAHGFINLTSDLLMEDEKSGVFEHEKEDHDEVYASTIQA